MSAQTVYANLENKRGLLQALMDQRVRGDAPAPPFLLPPGEDDPADPLEFLRQLAAAGRRLSNAQLRSGPSCARPPHRIP